MSSSSAAVLRARPSPLVVAGFTVALLLAWRSAPRVVGLLARLTTWRRPRGQIRAPAPPPAADPGSKPIHESSVNVIYRVTADMTDEYDRIYGGVVLKIIDTVAGVAARRHAEMPCVTISLDRVVLIKELRLGDIMHVDASVNRAWGSSLEVGVKVIREDPQTGEQSYSCHAYLTFVAIAKGPASHSGPPPSLRLGGRVTSDTEAPKAPRPKLKHVIPHTTLEKKRYLLAGRRRALRMSMQTSPSEFLIPFRKEVLAMTYPGSTPEQVRSQEDQIVSVEAEMVADALETHDPTIRVDGDFVTGDPSVYGPEPPRVLLEDVRRILELKKSEANSPAGSSGAGTPNRMPLISHLSHLDAANDAEWVGSRSASPLPPSHSQDSSPPPEVIEEIAMEKTLVSALHIVFPQHANTVGVLFGGQLMEWMEKTSVIAAHRLKRDCAWATAGMDGLEFREAVATGEVLTFRAVVTKVFGSSIEVYCCSHADIPGSPTPLSTPRFTNECFFTLVALSPEASVPVSINARITFTPGSAAEKVSETADDRRAERLADRRMLVRVYGHN